MKDYLLKFRSQAFDGAISLFKRTLIPNFILSIIISLVALAVITPLALKAFNISLKEFIDMGENMQGFSQRANSGEDPRTIFSNLFNSFNMLFVFLMIITGLILYSWMFNAYFQLNDNEVKNKDNSFLHALSKSFSRKTFAILGYTLIYLLIYIGIFVLFVVLIALLMQTAGFIAAIAGFILFFVVMIFMLRFTLGFPAIVHGNMTVAESLSFSFRHLTWKRAGLIFLVSIILLIALMLISLVISLITMAIVNKETSGSLTFLIVSQILNTITLAIIGSFIYASMTAQYFRYSNDEVEDENMDRHLVSEDSE
jgi:hypothetical protein